MARALLLAATLLALIPCSAQAQSRLMFNACDSKDRIYSVLSNRYGEAQIWYGVTSSGNLVELWASTKDPRTFTIIEWLSGKVGCMRLNGDHWRAEFLKYDGDAL
jgi:hypothetical protein